MVVLMLGAVRARRVRECFSRERAEKAVKNMGAWNDTSSCRVVEYKMSICDS